MKHRDSTYSKLRAEKKENERIIQADLETVKRVHKYYVEPRQNTTHSLEQALWLTYVEEYCVNDYRSVINDLNSCEVNKKGIKVALEYLQETVGVKFDTHQKDFKKCINDFLGAILGNGINMSIFINKKENKEDANDEKTDLNPQKVKKPKTKKEENCYEIDEEDLEYLMFLYATRKRADATYLINKNYNAVSDYYFELIHLGALTLVKKNKIPQMSEDDWQRRYEVKFGIERRRMEEKYNELESRFALIESLVHDLMTLPSNSEMISQRCDQCIEVLDSCFRGLSNIADQMKGDNRIDWEEIDQILKRSKDKKE